MWVYGHRDLIQGVVADRDSEFVKVARWLRQLSNAVALLRNAAVLARPFTPLSLIPPPLVHFFLF